MSYFSGLSNLPKIPKAAKVALGVGAAVRLARSGVQRYQDRKKSEEQDTTHTTHQDSSTPTTQPKKKKYEFEKYMNRSLKEGMAEPSENIPINPIQSLVPNPNPKVFGRSVTSVMNRQRNRYDPKVGAKHVKNQISQSRRYTSKPQGTGYSSRIGKLVG